MRNAGGVCKRWAERQRSVLERQAYLGIEGFSPEADAKALQEALYKIKLALN